jgi:hypothetical protein
MTLTAALVLAGLLTIPAAAGAAYRHLTRSNP